MSQPAGAGLVTVIAISRSSTPLEPTSAIESYIFQLFQRFHVAVVTWEGFSAPFSV